MSFLELNNVSKRYGDTSVFRHLNLEIVEGEFLAIVGFSGSGKTTLISMIAGLLAPDSGKILLKGKPILGPGRDRGVVFQNYSLLPWLSVYENVMLAVKHAFPDWSIAQKQEQVEKYLEMVNLTNAKHKKPRELSGGMRQRVSVARALSMDPEVLLLDEPLSALDALTRSTLQDEIENIWERDQKTVVLITNDVDEAILLADRIIPMTPGPNAKLGNPYPVPLLRPRDRKALNHNSEFKRIRNAVTQSLLQARKSSFSEIKKEFPLPDLKPVMV